MDQVAALVLAGGRAGNFGALAEHRTKAAFPVGGYYRIIDFTLSNLSRAGVRHIGIIIQYMPASLMEHIGSGRPWDFDMADRHLRFMTPFVGIRETRWFHGTGDAIAKNLNLVNLPNVRDVLILSGEHIYRMDYRQLIAEHRKTDADLTVVCTKIPPTRQHPRFGNVVTDESGRIQSFTEKPERPVSPLVSMGIYCFRREALVSMMDRVATQGGYDDFSLTRDVIQDQVADVKAQAWIFDGPWHYIADLQEYFDFHMKIARGAEALMEGPWDIITNFSDRQLGFRPPAFFDAQSQVEHSIVSPGCRIVGRVEGSVLSPGVVVGPDTTVRNCVILHDVKIGARCHLDHVVVDKDVCIEDGVRVGLDPNVETPAYPPPPITVLPKSCRIHAGEIVPPGGTIDSPVLI